MTDMMSAVDGTSQITYVYECDTEPESEVSGESDPDGGEDTIRDALLDSRGPGPVSTAGTRTRSAARGGGDEPPCLDDLYIDDAYLFEVVMDEDMTSDVSDQSSHSDEGRDVTYHVNKFNYVPLLTGDGCNGDVPSRSRSSDIRDTRQQVGHVCVIYH
jgi:hypothetical protein